MNASRLSSAAIALALCGSAAHAQSNAELKAMLDQALKTIQELNDRVKALEQQKAATAPASAPTSAAAAAAAPSSAAAPPAAPPPAVAGAPVVAPNSTADAGAREPDKARVEIYGQAMVDAIQDFKRMDPTWNATMRPSKIPVTCPGDAGCGKDGATIFSVRQSSLGFKAFVPTAYGEIRTDVSFDLFATDGGTQVHWLNAWAELGMFGVGQTYSVFMDIDAFPNTIDYWGPSGMVFLRNPQLRVTPFSRDGMTVAIALESPGSAVDTGKVSQVDPELGAGITGWNRRPDLTAAFRLDRDWGHVQAAGILREVGYQNPASASGNPSGHRTGYGLNLAGAVKVFGRDKLSWQVAGGKAIASYMNDGGIDLAPDASLRAEAVPSIGWLVYYHHPWSDRWSSAIGYSEHRQDNSGGQLGNAFRRGAYSSANVLFVPAKNVTTGAELIWGQLTHKDGSSAEDYRLQFSTKVTF
jgi:hypothetical protein